MDPISSEAGASGTTPGALAAPNADSQQHDPLVKKWADRVEAGKKHWRKFHQRVRYNRKLVRGIDDNADAASPAYNKDRANLLSSTLMVVLSRVYAKNPEMSAEPTNKAKNLRLFCDTVSRVTQVMLEDAKLKKKAKATVKAAMTCAFGVVKVQYQRVTQGELDPLMRSRIQDTQDNLQHIESLLKKLDDPAERATQETTEAQLKQALAGLQAQAEVIAAEGLVIDRVRTDRLIIDPAVEDIWEYEDAGWMAEEIPMRKSKARGMLPEFDFKGVHQYAPGTEEKADGPRQLFSPNQSSEDDPIIVVVEVWSKLDGRIYTLVRGCNHAFAREPYTPKVTGERWWPYFVLPFQSVDGEFVAQSLVDLCEKLQTEHNETRDKFADLRRTIRPHFIISADVKDKDIKTRIHPELGEMVVINTQGGKVSDFAVQATQLTIDPALFDTTPIRNDWEMVSGLQDAARSIVTQAKTATEAAISDQALAARVSEFRDQIEDWLTEVAQYASELCLLAMTPQQVEQIMGAPQEPDEAEMAKYAMATVQAQAVGGMPPPPPEPVPSYEWPADRRPETVFNLIQMKIRAGSTAAPNHLQMQENWIKALPLIEKAIMAIRTIEAGGGDATVERELVKETIGRFDPTIDVERFLPPKAVPMLPTTAAGMPGSAGLPAPGAGAAPLTPEFPMEQAGMQVGGRPSTVPVQ